MSAWTDDELRRIGEAEELEIAPVRRDGTLRSRAAAEEGGLKPALDSVAGCCLSGGGSPSLAP
jgi:hypothetical protein